MKLLQEMLRLISEDKKPSSISTAAKIYHRDYIKTRKAPYRKYNKNKKG